MGRYSDQLQARLKKGGNFSPAAKGKRFAKGQIPLSRLLPQKEPEPPRTVFAIVVPEHPDKYPLHSKDGMPDKGAVYGGECNRTACRRTGATWYNQTTRGYYCPDDGRAINFERGAPPLCIEVTRDLTYEEQDEHYKTHMEAYSAYTRKKRESLGKPLI